MPHYADGTEAVVGDLVKGKGYSVAHEIIGKVVNVRPGESCTLSVAYVGTANEVFFLQPDHWRMPFAKCHVVAAIEFGDTKSFTKIG